MYCCMNNLLRFHFSWAADLVLACMINIHYSCHSALNQIWWTAISSSGVEGSFPPSHLVSNEAWCCIGYKLPDLLEAHLLPPEYLVLLEWRSMAIWHSSKSCCTVTLKQFSWPAISSTKVSFIDKAVSDRCSLQWN